MSNDQNSRGSGSPEAADTDDWAAPEDAVLVIRAWHEGGTDDQEKWHWRGQISHENTTSQFVGLGMLFTAITGMLNTVASTQDGKVSDG